ncbi:glycosyltransferase family 2 protein [Paracoccus sp. p4-l81]|uniref:glycosyltransferase family 2 protein n=1 Tax=unclassified Paracoccus (in: a-proteobacteria) TaxID=2688777 RepID=UPI0035BAC024
MRLPISAFIICQDEEAVIESCLRSLSMCADIVVVDSGSTDRTVAIVQGLIDEGMPIRLFHEAWRGYGAQKQFALDQCTQDWCFSVDSDERVSARLTAALPAMIQTDGVDGWRVTRYDYLNGYGYVPPRAHERHHNRLFRRGTGRFDPTDRVHEGIAIDGTVRKAPEGGLLHFRPIPLAEEIGKKNKYSSLKAQMKRERGIAARPWKMVFSPIVFFGRWYFGHGLWRCGWAGFIHAATGGIYSFLTEAKRWEAEAIARKPPIEPPEPDGY